MVKLNKKNYSSKNTLRNLYCGYRFKLDKDVSWMGIDFPKWSTIQYR